VLYPTNTLNNFGIYKKKSASNRRRRRRIPYPRDSGIAELAVISGQVIGGDKITPAFDQQFMCQSDFNGTSDSKAGCQPFIFLLVEENYRACLTPALLNSDVGSRWFMRGREGKKAEVGLRNAEGGRFEED